MTVLPVSLKLCDISGRIEKTLFEKSMRGGYYDEKIDLSSFSKGIYFLRLEIGNKYLARKLIVL